MTSDEVLAALEQSRGMVEARLQPESTETFGACSAKDLLFHLAVWQRFFGIELRVRREADRKATASEMLGRPLDAEASEALMALDTDQSNAHFYELYRDEGWPAAIELWRESCDRLHGEVAQLSDQQLAEGEPLWHRIGGESFTHIAGHLSGPPEGVQ
jgi:hypothetical protein